MNRDAKEDRKCKILRGIYTSSWGISMITQAIVATLEIFMMVYTLVNPTLYGPYIGVYRAFYVALFSAAMVYIALNIAIKRDIEHRHMWLNVVNPLYAAFFFAWALGITYHDAMTIGVVDPTVFMTFSLIVPLSFFLFPFAYAVIVAVADAFMFSLMATVSGALGPMINLSIFIIFQLVLGVSFLRLKTHLAERIVKEQENAEIDVLTGFGNRRAYEKEIERLSEERSQDGLVYLAIDINELKEINDTHGHEAGDRLIVGAAQCIRQCFGERGRIYRVGGDEFAVLIPASRDEVEKSLGAYENSMAAWSEQNGMRLSTAYGCAELAEREDRDIIELARTADRRMYEAKADYYRTNGRDRRKGRYAADA